MTGNSEDESRGHEGSGMAFKARLSGVAASKLAAKHFHVLVVLFVLAFNVWLFHYTESHEIDTEQKRRLTSGLSHDKARHFVYHYYYNDLFPVVSLAENKPYSQKGASDLLDAAGADLLMEYRHWARLGENSRIFAYMPGALIKGSPEAPSVKWFNAMVFVLALLICFLGFVRAGKKYLGGLLVLLVNITPFFWYEVYQNENVFALPGSVFLMVLGLNVPLLFRWVPFWKAFGLSALSGVLIGCFSEMRSEIVAVAGSAMLLHLFAATYNPRRRWALVAILAVGVVATRQSLRGYFEYKFQEAYEVVREHGGHPYTGLRIKSHLLWHPIFCGLGDFDTEYGFAWSDHVAYAYAVPAIKAKYGLAIRYTPGNYHTDYYYDRAKKYYVKFDEIGVYDGILREKVLTTIRNDPLWYIEILAKRSGRLLWRTLPVPFLGFVMVGLWIYLFRKRRWDYLVLVLASLPLSVTPLLIFSGGNTVYNSMYSYIVLAMVVELLFVHFVRPTKSG